jgi:hypothetical protein
MKSKKILTLLLLCTTILTSFSFDLKDVLRQGLKAAGVSALVRSMGPELDKFINSILSSKGAQNREATRVVPVITFGDSTAVGAVQITGDKDLIKKVRHVIAYEDKLHSKYRVKVYIPSSHSNPLKLDRVYGVSVTAIIEGFI